MEMGCGTLDVRYERRTVTGSSSKRTMVVVLLLLLSYLWGGLFAREA